MRFNLRLKLFCLSVYYIKEINQLYNRLAVISSYVKLNFVTLFLILLLLVVCTFIGMHGFNVDTPDVCQIEIVLETIRYHMCIFNDVWLFH